MIARPVHPTKGVSKFQVASSSCRPLRSTAPAHLPVYPHGPLKRPFFSGTPYSRSPAATKWGIFSEARQPLLDAAAVFTTAVQEKNVHDIERSYQQLRKLHVDSPSSERRTLHSLPQIAGGWKSRLGLSSTRYGNFNALVLQDAIHTLVYGGQLASKKPRLQDVFLSVEIMKDMGTLFGLAPTERLEGVILAGLAKLDPYRALSMLLELESTAHTTGDVFLPESSTSQSKTLLEDYEVVMQAFVTSRNGPGARQVLDHLLEHPRIRPNTDIWYLYINVLGSPTNTPPDLGAIEDALVEMEKKCGVIPNARLLADVITQYNKANDPVRAQPHVDALKSVLRTGVPAYTPAMERFALGALVAHSGLKGGYAEALSEALAFKIAGYTHGPRSVQALIRLEDSPTWTADLMVEVAAQLDARLTPMSWAMAVNRAKVQTGNIELSLAIYRQAKLRRVKVVSPLVDPIIHALCNRKSPPTTEDVNLALDLYYDLRDSHTSTASAEELLDNDTLSPSLSPIREPPDVGIFKTLLRAVSLTRTPSQMTSDILIQLLVDMRQFQIKIEPSFVQDVFAELLRASESHDTAFKLWTYLRQLDETVLSETGYKKVLEQFASLSFEDDPLPSLPHYLDIVRDMRSAGTTISSFVYNILFTRYSSIARSLPREILPGSSESEIHDRVYQAVKRLHLTLKVDAGLTPTIEVLNALMNAYNHLDAHGDVIKVWDELSWGKPSFNHTTIDIALDSCGFGGDVRGANAVWRRVHTQGKQEFIPTVNNWTSWIECQVRLGRFDTAWSSFQRMAGGSDRTTIPEPDLKCAEVMLKYARVHGMIMDDAMRFVQWKLPHLYPQLRDRLGMDNPSK